MYVRFDAGVERSKASSVLLDKLRAIGAKPIITPYIIRNVYEGEDVALATKLKQIYQNEETTDLYYQETPKRRG